VVVKTTCQHGHLRAHWRIDGLVRLPAGGYAFSATDQFRRRLLANQQRPAKAPLFGKCLIEPRCSGEAGDFALRPNEHHSGRNWAQDQIRAIA